MKNQFENIKVGDRLWIADGYSGRRVAPVLSRTRTLLRVANGIGNPQSFRISQSDYDESWSAYESPSRMFGEHIERLATAGDCADWDKDQAEKSAELDRNYQAKIKADAAIKELTAIFGKETILVGNAQWGTREQRSDKFDVTFYSLTEQQVRQLALNLEEKS